MGSLLLRLVCLFLALSVLAGQALAGDVPRSARPALWTVEAGAGRMYLLGSIHLLPPETQWQTPEIRAALAASQVFVFEAPIHDANDAMARFVERHGRLKGERLRDLIGRDAHDKVSKAAWKVQYPPRLLERLRPWLAAIHLELHASLRLGSSPHYGVDHVIEQMATKRQMRTAYLETVDEQLSNFLKLSRNEEIAYLNATAAGILTKPDGPRELLEAWAAGDVGRLEFLIDEGLAEVPQLKALLLTARNRKWMNAVEGMLETGETHFVTVGAAHLVGRDGLIGMLRARGYKVSGPAADALPPGTRSLR